MKFERSRRLKSLPPYLFAEIDRLKNEVKARGVDVIDLGIGDPDRPTSDKVVAAAREAVSDPANHRYPSYNGLLEFRQKVAEYCQGRFGVSLNPQTEVMTLIGSKEAVAHFPLAFVNPGDVVLYTSPGYPVYHVSAVFSGGEPFAVPLREENGFFPDLAAIPPDVVRRAKIFFFNYPNNPTSAEAGPEQFEALVEFGLKNDLILVHDAAYVDMTFDGYVAPSFLETPGAMDCAIELHSFSKPFQMTGWRVGFAAGNAELISGLLAVKSNLDSGVFQAIQKAAMAGLDIPAAERAAGMIEYGRRRRVVVEGFKDLGLSVWPTRGTFYVWARVPQGLTSTAWASRLLKEAGVVVTPGNGFGRDGEGYFRVALSVTGARLQEAVERMKRLSL